MPWICITSFPEVTKSNKKGKKCHGRGCSQKSHRTHPQCLYVYIFVTLFFLLSILCGSDKISKKQ